MLRKFKGSNCGYPSVHSLKKTESISNLKSKMGEIMPKIMY